ncbi:MAG: AcrR family transcriptional regulator [Arcticibacterium sp.]|jgi:AcrR family transcriptional regulator
MPKKTFSNLDEGKRKQIIDSFLREFAVKPYDEASITVVVKELGIAKGSIYQYFEDKLDLFLFLIDECVAVKLEYVVMLDRKSFPDFWAYFRELYIHGYQFDKENPLQSHFLHNLINNLKSVSIMHIFNKMLNQSMLGFEAMVNQEVSLGLFRDDIPSQTMGFMLYKVGIGIQEQLELIGVINPKESIQKNIPVYQGKKEELLQMVDDYIKLMKPSFDKN